MIESVLRGMEWLRAHPAFEAVLALTLAFGCLLLAYGIFDGDPPLLWKREISDRTRRSCLWFGSAAIVVFALVLLPLPAAVDYLLKHEATLLVDGRAVGEGTQVAAFDESGERIVGRLELRIGEIDVRLPNVTSLPEDWSAYKRPLRLMAAGRDLTGTPLYVAEGETNTSVSDPLVVVDAGDRELARV